jgi:predicted transcriptional regulator
MGQPTTFIKIDRNLPEWEWYHYPETLVLFIHLLIKARIVDGYSYGVELKRGQHIFGRKKLSEETGLSEQSIRTSLNRLKSTNDITIKSTNKFSIVTICKYDTYQDYNSYINQQNIASSTSNQPAINQQSTSNQPLTKNIKKLKNEKNNTLYSDDFLKFWNSYKRHDGKAEAYKSFNKCKIDDIDFLVKAVEYYNQEYVKKNGSDLQYYPMPTTYLNQKRYLDYEDKQATPENIIDKVWRICGSDLDFYLEYPDIHEKPEGLTDEDITAYKQAKGIV